MNDYDAMPAGERPAVMAPHDLYAEYKMDPKASRNGVTMPIYAFSTEGYPLVPNYAGTRLVRAQVAVHGMTYVGIRLPEEPPLTGPFTPALPGLVAMFRDGHEEPVSFFDLHGRTVLMVEDEGVCYLTLTDATSDVKRVEYRPPLHERGTDHGTQP